MATLLLNNSLESIDLPLSIKPLPSRLLDKLYNSFTIRLFPEKTQAARTSVTWSDLNASSSISEFVSAVQLWDSDSVYTRGFAGSSSDGTSMTRQFLVGNSDDNILEGGSGQDVLIGRFGNDTLTGEAGADSFVFLSSQDGVDTITDFDVLKDNIVVSASGFAGLTAPPVGQEVLLTPEQFSLGSSTTTSNAGFTYNPTNGILAYDSDGIGSQTQIAIAQLSSNLDFTYQNIQVVA
ncbi:MAG: calcium-binding protein [Scytonema sp. PMC 1069.18]|nr:calcium-binding protein [Scytonema sp. PMC 1069.18]MEC4885507.1 calcium-binding protein [Scytonema sp. PMC 1070.18]